MLEVIQTCHLDDGPIGRKRAPKPDNAAIGRQGLAGRANDFLITAPNHRFQVLRQGLAGHGHAVAMQKACLEQGLEQHGHAARLAHILGHKPAAGLQIGQIRRPSEDFRHIAQ